MSRVKKAYPLNGKTMFGLSTMRWTITASSSLMTSAFMLYLTDYSGIGQAAATIGTILLLVGRIFDAVDDPLQGWLMDRSPRTSIGKFKPFMLGGILMCSIAVILLFNVPSFKSLTAQIIWLSVAYLMYEVGFSFQPHVPIVHSLTSDPKVREKLLITPRIIEQFVVIPFSFFLSLVVVIGNAIGSMKTGIGLLAVIFVAPTMIMSLIGTACVKEGVVAESGESVGFKKIVEMFKTNRPLWISFFSGIFGGCTFAFVMASSAYYIKWAFGPEDFGMYSAVLGSITLFGIITGTLVAPKVLKKFEPYMSSALCSFVTAVSLVLIYLLSLIGLNNPILFFTLMFLAMISMGMSYIPGSLINMETMDYSLYKTGKGMQAINQSARNFLEKAQGALAGAATGAVLIAVGYIVNEAGDYVGTAPVESLLSGLLLVCCLIPAALALIAGLIMCFMYPLKGKVRKEMYEEIERRKANMGNEK